MTKIAIVNSSITPIGGGITKSNIALLIELNKIQDINIDMYVFSKDIDPILKHLDNINVIHPSKLLHIISTNPHQLNSFQKIIFVIFNKFKVKMPNKYISTLDRLVKVNLSNYDVAISFTNDIPNVNEYYYANDYVLKKINANKKITWIHNDPKKLGINDYIVNNYLNKFDTSICVSNANKNTLLEMFPNLKKKIDVIYGCIIEQRVEKLEKDDNKFKIISIGRLAEQKRFDRAIEVAKILKDNNVNFVWNIFGEGPDKDKLELKIKEYKLENQLYLKGYSSNVANELVNSDIFIITSDYEGLGLVTLEALFYGIPVISTNYPCAYEIIDNGKTGYITSMNPIDISNKIIELNKNKKLYIEMKRNIKNMKSPNEKAMEQFINVVMEEQ